MGILAKIEEPLCTTVPVLTVTFHLLGPGSVGSQRLIDFVMAQGLRVWYLDAGTLRQAFELMAQYADRPMDLAAASLVVLAEALKLRKIFTIDRGDFATYRIKQGYRHLAFEMVS